MRRHQSDQKDPPENQRARPRGALAQRSGPLFPPLLKTREPQASQQAARESEEMQELERSAEQRAERRVVALEETGMLPNLEILRYVNRLADLLFMMARYVDRELPMEIVTGTRIEAD